MDVCKKPSNGLQVVTSQQTFQTGQASLTVSTAPVPTSGSLLIELAAPTTAAAGYEGVAGLDTFQLVAKDWVGLQGRQLQRVLHRSLLEARQPLYEKHSCPRTPLLDLRIGVCPS